MKAKKCWLMVLCLLILVVSTIVFASISCPAKEEHKVMVKETVRDYFTNPTHEKLMDLQDMLKVYATHDFMACFKKEKKCLDGTAYGTCSFNKPRYCDKGNLLDKCSVCGCDFGYECQSDETCRKTEEGTCSDGTSYGECSTTKPKYCDNSILIDNCSTCNCDTDYECQMNGSCVFDPYTANDFYVATDGNDQWSGRLAEPNSEGTDGPFATIEKARDTIYQLKKEGRLNKLVNVLVREGTYFLNKPFVLSEENPGAAEYPITYQAYPGENVIISGGRRISGWTRYDNNIFVTHIPDVKSGKLSFNSLFINGRRAIRARTPNEGLYYYINGVDEETKHIAFTFKEGTINKDWSYLTDIEVVSYRQWEQSRHKISRVEGNKVYFASEQARPYNWNYESGTGRYFVENVFEGLDSSGEWYLNKHTGDLYYWPLPGEDILSSDAIAPVLNRLVQVQDSANINLKGFIFSHTDWQLPEGGYQGYQAGYFIADPPAIEFYLTDNCTFEDNVISHVGAYALSSVSKNLRIEGNEIYDAGAGGIKVGVSEGIGYGKTYNNMISNNRIHDLGAVYKEGVGIWVLISGDNTISHNSIYNTAYSGVSVGWRWSAGDSPCKNNIIEYNEIYDVMRELNDGGGIYMLGKQPGTIIRNNVVHDVIYTSHLHKTHLFGIYLDQGSKDMHVKNNIVYRIGHAGLLLHRTFDNIIENNIFVDGMNSQLYFVGTNNADPETGVLPSGNVFRKNIVYYTSPNAQLFNADNYHSIKESDYNLYFSPYYENPNFNFNWWKQTYNFDHNSIVADPLFLDYSKDNLNIRGGSPAFELNIQPISIDDVGPHEERTCSETWGNTCSLSETCYGYWLLASDTNRCCSGSCAPADAVLYGDFDGSGIQDTLQILQTVTRWDMILGKNGITKTWLTGWGGGNKNYVGDFNGDGKDDVLLILQSDLKWYLAISDGTKFITYPNALYGLGAGNKDIIGDFDGDKKDDALIIWYDTTKNQWYWLYAKSQGTSFEANTALTGYGYGYNACARDYDGDGAAEVIVEYQPNYCAKLNKNTNKFDIQSCTRTC